MLIYAGGLVNNGITSSLLNLLENIDYERFEVVIFLQRQNNKIALDNLNRVNKNVKIILRSGGFFATLAENYRNNYVRSRGLISNKEEKVFPFKAYQREFRRLFGNSEFDYVIDFSGYSMFWSNLLLGTESKKKFVYLHSDMVEDLVKIVGNRRPHIINLKGLMTIYPKFDKLINVSDNIHRINKKKLKRFNVNDKFVTVNNMLNLNKIYNDINKQDNIINTHEENKKLIIANSPSGIELIKFNKNNYNIFASGRLSPEKGFDNLIEGFYYISNEYPDAMLYILGEGQERTNLETLIHSYGLNERVFLLGHQSNPFSLINEADLFVLSSHYEGQGLVLLECMALNKNVLSTDLDVTREILGNGKYGMLKNDDAKSLSEGIEKFLKKENPQYQKFDIESYNELALSQFYSIFE
ncbi:glycosyltransferase [Mammaliicoccus sciuri]|nr:glycosyltransferase [Mammaliicoccus sciuri]MCD8880527.1 glycosyltransferase [Mammaliicoccus sciuri]